MWKTLLLLATACSVRSATFRDIDGGSDATDAAGTTTTTIDVPAGELAGPVTWTRDHTYVLHGHVFVTSGTLTIEPGTTIKGDHDSALVVTKDAAIDARGTALSPIVFTSNHSPASPGDWGGLVLLGDAPINDPTGSSVVDGFAQTYGGSDPDHDCGTLAYVRILYAGYPIAANLALAALTLGACGTGTSIDHLQLHRSAGDGLAIFGGSSFLRHLVITQSEDDAIDWDLGWGGRIQFLVAQQRPGCGDTAIEGDNNTSNPNLFPLSAPEIYNMTLVGANGAATDPQGAIHLRNGSGGRLNNVIVMGFPKYAIDVDGASSVARTTSSQGVLYRKSSYLIKPGSVASNWPSDFDGPPPSGNDDGFDEAKFFGVFAGNILDVPVNLTAPFDLSTPSWKPGAGSPVVGSCSSPAPSGFDSSATFCGAIGEDDWTTGWTLYPD